MTGYLAREITPRLERALRQFPVVLSGLRQTGKRTLLQNEPAIVRGHAYRTLDDFPTLAAAKTNPEALLEGATILYYFENRDEIKILEIIDVPDGK